jgi:hypothetical protein
MKRLEVIILKYSKKIKCLKNFCAEKIKIFVADARIK